MLSVGIVCIRAWVWMQDIEVLVLLEKRFIVQNPNFVSLRIFTREWVLLLKRKSDEYQCLCGWCGKCVAN